MNEAYYPKPGSTALRALDHLEQFAGDDLISATRLATEVNASPTSIVQAMQRSVDAGLIRQGMIPGIGIGFGLPLPKEPKSVLDTGSWIKGTPPVDDEPKVEESDSSAVDGWIEHDGMNMPVAPLTVVEVRRIGGSVEQDKAGEFGGFWNNDGSLGDILAYRVVSEASLRYALWSTGELHIETGAVAVRLTREETAQLFAYLESARGGLCA